MSFNFLQSVAVQVISKEKDSNKQSKGSGVLLEYNSEFFVITAEHCIFGKKGFNRFSEIETEIDVINNNGSYKSILFKKDEIIDYAILKVIDFNHEIFTYHIDKKPIEKGIPCVFRGISKKLSEFKNYPCDVRDVTEEKIVIKSKDSFNDSSGDDSVKNAEGISGSGIFLEIGSKYYLVGIVKNLKNEQGTHDEIDCIPINFLSDVFNNIKYSSVFELHDLEDILRDIEINVAEETINNWKIAKSADFDKIKRKNGYLYKNSKLNIVVLNTVKQFLDGDKFLSLIQSKNPILHKNIEDYILRKGNEIFSLHSCSIETSKEGIKIIRDIQKEIQLELIYIKGIPSEKFILIKQYAIAEWLRSCHLNFVDNEDID